MTLPDNLPPQLEGAEESYGPLATLLQYVDSAHLDPEYVEGLIGSILAASHEQARKRLVHVVWAEMGTLTLNAARPRYYAGWCDGVETAVDKIKSAALGTCLTCRTPIGYIPAPTGGWWAHENHPVDNHDAAPFTR